MQISDYDDLVGLSNLYLWRSKDADDKGLEYKAEEYKQISNALYLEFQRQIHDHTCFDISDIMGWGPVYRHLKADWPAFERHSELGKSKSYTFFDAVKDWLFSKMNWLNWLSPSFPSFFRSLWHNIRVFLDWYLRPWNHIRVWFMQSFINLNGCKPVNDEVSWIYARNRKDDCAHYLLSFTGFHYTLKKYWYVPENGEQNALILASCLSFTGDEGTLTQVPEQYKVESAKLCSGWVFGWRSFVREMNKIIHLTPDLDWNKYIF